MRLEFLFSSVNLIFLLILSLGSSEEEGSDNTAGMRVLSIDIECMAQKGFPQPQRDPVITIACIGKLHNKDSNKILAKVVFQQGTCLKIDDCVVKTHKSEIDLLNDFEKFLAKFDPDFITGYNVVDFDINYLLTRAKTLKMANFGNWGRLKNRRVEISQRNTDGSRARKGVYRLKIHGRVELDVLNIIKDEYRLDNYSLNSVSSALLGQQKEDVHYTMISTLQTTSKETRTRLARYCLKDALLPLRLLDQLKIIYSHIEMLRIIGLTFRILLNRGTKIRVLSMIYKKAKKRDMVIPSPPIDMESKESKGIAFLGGNLFEAKSNFYVDQPIAVLDYASFYPSIMIAYNLCYCTWIQDKHDSVRNSGTASIHLGGVDAGRDQEDDMEIQLDGLIEDVDYVKTPAQGGFYYVKKGLRKGVIPEILEELLGARKAVKALLKASKRQLKELVAKLSASKDPQSFKNSKIEDLELKCSLLNTRQLAIKLAANCVFGFTGAVNFPMLTSAGIARSVVAFGRQFLELAKEHVETNYTTKNGYKYNSEVIYGDTDSIFVNFGKVTKKEVFSLGAKISQEVTALNRSPIHLEFEQVMSPFLLTHLRRYTGMKFTSLHDPGVVLSKGTENARRDYCPLVRETISGVLEILLRKKDVSEAKEYLKAIIADLMKGRIDISKLVITRGIYREIDYDRAPGSPGREKWGKRVGYKMEMPHVALARKLATRDPNNKPYIGDRVAYVVVKAGACTRLNEKVEDPVYAMENDLNIDYEYYKDHFLRKPVERLFRHIPKFKIDEIFDGVHSLVRAKEVVPKSSFMAGFLKKKLVCKIFLIFGFLDFGVF